LRSRWSAPRGALMAKEVAMDQVLERQSVPETIGEIEATLNYLVNDGVKIFTEASGGGAPDKRGGTLDPHVVVVRNGRRQAKEFALEREGFRFVRHDTKVVDFFNDEEVRRVYYPEMETLVKAESGASRVVVFDHTLRTADDALREARKIREVVPRVHNDYTEWSAPQRVRDILSDDAEALLRRRFAIVQVWRPIRRPVESFPLAICDARTVSPDDLVISERRYPNRVGQTYAITYNSQHKWFYFPHMRREEAIVFKVFDSETDGRARFTAHTAFDDPTSPPNASPRESIEIRTLAFF
jgi:hypothetical protein